MRNIFTFFVIILLFIAACRNKHVNNNIPDKSTADSIIGSDAKAKTGNNTDAYKKIDTIVNNVTSNSKHEAKSIEFEIVKLNPKDSCHKMSFFHYDRKYFHNDSLYCELLYKLKEVEKAARIVSPEGDYVLMMIDDRPQGKINYYQIALYRIRTKLDKMDRIDSYRINIKSKVIEKQDIVKDKWLPINY